MSQKEKSYKFYTDPGHGWLAVKVTELMELNVITKISQYSYLKGATAYLEEDCDAALFLEAYQEKYKSALRYHTKYIDKNSPIRSYERYNCDQAIRKAMMK